MPTIYHHHSLKAYNSFGVEAYARRFAKIEQESDITAILAEGHPIRLLGGGSNILLTQDIEDTILLNALKGIELVDENSDYVWVRAAAGESWHELVLWCIATASCTVLA